ncbi:ribonuclease G [Paraferrimonas haliotis]|uniref:Ribonuclease G Rng n=1 Tax=Paraferrimonas haliotis TaxID=2013866 RepID=A0AA37TMG0_9GAMM|nr:ribonuclease G [Paraferrimonas haliotis]GLS82358.1 ribonuclease G Rng [Paraferrimonas haliotis]
MAKYQDNALSAELLINVTPTESRVALVENGTLQEIHIERRMKRGLVGNVYKGKVTRVLPGMQAAFIDIGLDKAAFLHASDIVVHTECVDEEDKQKLQANIGRLVHQGQELVVQVVKDPIGTKGARLTTDITLPSRYLVFMPSASHVGVSQRIESEQERERLRKLTEPFVDESGGFIIRTAAEGVGEQELIQDAKFLRQVWKKVLERKARKGVRDLYRDLILPVRIIRDFVGTKLDKVLVDSHQTIEELSMFCREFMPELTDKLTLYRGPNPLFDQYDVEKEIQRALEKRVDLKSGGYMIVDQTEAMTTIDLNTGAFVGSRNLEETIFNLNLEATQAIAHQLRLRNLGGIIIIDFIDMSSSEHQTRVLTALEQALASDRVKTNISGFSSLGLVEMTRKRTRESLEHVLCDECPCCKGRGSMKTVETVSFEILREIIRVDRAYDADEFVVYCAPSVFESLSTQDNELVAELEVYLGKKINLRNEHLYTQDKFDVVMM